MSMKSHELRQSFVDFFKKEGHIHLPSSSLIPYGDKSLLFTNSGMNQFKNWFLGSEPAQHPRVVTVQKCLRAGGKHNDLENVGPSFRHHTFFEMMGNFAFRDYFKREAIVFAWKLMTEHFQLPEEKLYVTYYEKDEETHRIWSKDIGLPQERIFPFGEKDNFWRMGEVGPCGPNTEIFYDYGSPMGQSSDPYKSLQREEDRLVEIYNLVFMEYFEEASGKRSPLPHPCIDTGAGLERLLSVLQSKKNNYATDLFTGLIQCACDALKVEYEPDPLKFHKLSPFEKQAVVALQVLSDHVRASAFLMAEGVFPANEGQAYVLRRILRRAMRFNYQMNPQVFVLVPMLQKCIEEMSSAYPELAKSREKILSLVQREQDSFSKSLEKGMELISDLKAKQKTKQKAGQGSGGGGKATLSGEVAFRLYDTYGFPFDLTCLVAREEKMEVDAKGFHALLQLARQRSRQHQQKQRQVEQQSGKQSESVLLSFLDGLAKQKKENTFVGYEVLKTRAVVLGLLPFPSSASSTSSTSPASPASPASSTSSGSGNSCFQVVFSQTPFYAEGGGQVADRGTVSFSSSASLQAKVLDCQKKQSYLVHFLEIEEGTLKEGDEVELEVNCLHRDSVRAHHSATHLLHESLGYVLGPEVEQAGSLVTPEALRFDFRFHRPLEERELQLVEDRVNGHIGQFHPVVMEKMSYNSAVKHGAKALFENKYGDEVRVISMGPSMELCGGTHVAHTGEIRLFKILRESGVAAGVRRVEALVGAKAVQKAFSFVRESEHLYSQLHLEKAKEGQLNQWLQGHLQKHETLKKEYKQLLESQQRTKIRQEDFLSKALRAEIKSGGSGAELLLHQIKDEDRGALLQVMDVLREKKPSSCMILMGGGKTKYPVLVSVSRDLQEKLPAPEVFKTVTSLLGGKGGGKPGLAQGFVLKKENLSKVFRKVQETFHL